LNISSIDIMSNVNKKFLFGDKQSTLQFNAKR